MTKTPKRRQVYRVCAVCGRRHGVTYGFRSTLRRLGIEGDKAVPECVKLAQAQHELYQPIIDAATPRIIGEFMEALGMVKK